MEKLTSLFELFTKNGGGKEFLNIIKESYNNKEISREELKFLFSIDNESSNNLIHEEKLVKTPPLIISVVKEENRNQGPNETSYFKVFRYPSNGSENDDCLRISFYGPLYELDHKHTYKNLLSDDEKVTLINILSETYIPTPTKHQEVTQYNIALQLYKDQKEKFYNNPKNKYTKIKYPDLPTIWIMAIHYFNFVNDGKPNVSLLLPMPNYLDLPNKK